MLKNVTRERGFYWVKYAGAWTIGQWSNRLEGWELVGSEDFYRDKDFDEIGYKIEYFDIEKE